MLTPVGDVRLGRNAHRAPEPDASPGNLPAQGARRSGQGLVQGTYTPELGRNLGADRRARVDELFPAEALRWRDIARDIAERVVRPKAAHYDREQTYPWEIRDALAEAGLFGVWIPKTYGGAGGGVLDLCLVVEELSRACGGVGVLFAVNALGSFPILLAGTDEQKETYLPDIAAGKKLIAFGLSERNAGSDAGGQQTTAVDDGDHWVLNGSKKWTTNGGAADIYSVFAVTDPTSKSRRISAILVEKGDPDSRSGAPRTRWAFAACPSWSCTSTTVASRRTDFWVAARAWASSTP